MITALNRTEQFVRDRLTQPDDEREVGDPVRAGSYTPCAVEHTPGRFCIRPEGHE